MYAYACARESRFLDLFTDLYWHKLAVVVTLAWSVGKESLVGLKFISDVWQKTLEIFRKTLEFFGEVRSEGPEGRKGCKRSGESPKASVGQRDEIKESFGHVEGKPYFCRE